MEGSNLAAQLSGEKEATTRLEKETRRLEYELESTALAGNCATQSGEAKLTARIRALESEVKSKEAECARAWAEVKVSYHLHNGS